MYSGLSRCIECLAFGRKEAAACLKLISCIFYVDGSNVDFSGMTSVSTKARALSVISAWATAGRDMFPFKLLECFTELWGRKALSRLMKCEHFWYWRFMMTVGKLSGLSPSASYRNQREDFQETVITTHLRNSLRRILAGILNVMLQKEKEKSDQSRKRDYRRNQRFDFR